MGEPMASGNWHVKEGKEQEFIERWQEFLGWTRDTQPGLVGASLMRDQADGAHFISDSEWKDADTRDAWRQEEGFAKGFAACRALCDDFYGGDYERVVAV